MAAPKKFNTVDELKKANESVDMVTMLGKSMLGFPQYNNAMRSVMWSSHTNQIQDVIEPEVPYVFTNFENLVGKYSDGYRQVHGTNQVFAKVVKFEDIVEHPQIYKLFLYNEDKDEYDVIERHPIENLTEMFAYAINNKHMDELEIGDVLFDEDVIYKSNSYDEYMNYSFGRNVLTMWTCDPNTSEDAATISESLSQKMKTIKGETVMIGLNDNDYALNLYGDDTNYKPFPDIGEESNGVVMATRRLYNDQVLYDFRSDVLKHYIDGDTEYSIDGTVYDVEIYCNNEELEDTTFNHQIIRYLESQNRYYKEIFEICEEIMNSGSKYTSNIDSLYGRARDILDPNKKWNNGNGVFSNLLIQIDIMRPEALGIGCKLTGRHGNKSVVSKILPDDQMPRTKDGRIVELLVNNLAIINRTIGGPIFEESQNFCSAMAVKHMKNDLKTLKERGNFLFEFISMFNERQGRMMKKTYDELTTSEKKEYIEGVMDGHIYLNMMPVGEDRPFFYKLLDVYKKYDWIKPEEIYIHRFGRDILTLQRQYIGEMYIVALKQTSKKGFSVRGMGAVNNKGLPERSYKNKSHMERYSTSDIRFGEFESLNFLVGMSPDELALFHAYYRSAPDARKELGKEILNPKGHVKLKKKYISRVGSIFSVIMKSLGYSMQVVDDEDVLKEIDDRHLKAHTESDGVTYLCTDYQDFLYERIDAVKNEILGSDLILDNEELKQKIDDRMMHSGYIVSTSQYKKLIGVFADNGDLFKGLQELSKEEISELSESSKDAV